MHGAIETYYKGYLFRSRLEARWAVFFDTAEIEWQYESQGFTARGACWLPDFYLPKTQTWVEIKGSNEALREDWERLALILDYDSPVPGMCESELSDERGVLLLGPIPEGKHGLHLHPLIQHRKGLHRKWAMLYPTGGAIRVEMMNLMFDFLEVPRNESNIETANTHWLIDSQFIPANRGWKKILEAYRAARAARFEHGQVGNVQPRAVQHI